MKLLALSDFSPDHGIFAGSLIRQDETMNPEARLPSRRQALVSEAVYAALAKVPWCARHGQECQTLCQPLREDGRYDVDLEHIIPISKGGSNSLHNCRWLCQLENQKKYNLPDPFYSAELYFDREIHVEKLRDHQQSLAYGLTTRDYKSLFLNPDSILRRFMLLAWLMGAGKTIGMLSILFGINHVRKKEFPGGRRIRKVLWLVHQRSLVKSLAKELREELTTLGISDLPPRVEEVGESWHWEKETDIFVACPQSLWDSDQNKMTHDQRVAILSRFDAIVVDEAQFAVEKYIAICDMAPFAYKFAVTATPMDGSGDLFCDMDGGAYRDHFALYSTFGYKAGRDRGIYKEILPFEEGVTTGNYIAEKGGAGTILSNGEERQVDSSRLEINYVRDKAIITRAKNLARLNSRNSTFDHHVMVRVGNIQHAKHWIKALEKEFAADGEKICGAWSGMKGRSLGDDQHPWMLVKTNKTQKGRMLPGSARFLFVVDMGQFGLNNRYCSTVAWLEPNRSQVELVQRIGRPIRLGPDQEHKDAINLLWSDAHAGMSRAIKKAIEYILSMPERMASFPSMSDLLDPDVQERNPIASVVKPVDRVRIATLVGRELGKGKSEDEALANAIKRLKEELPRAEPKYIDGVRRYGEELQNPEFRRKILGAGKRSEPIDLTLTEESSQAYTDEQVVEAVESEQVLRSLDKATRAEAVEALRAKTSEGTAYYKMALSDLKKRDDDARRVDRLISYSVSQLLTGQKAKDAPSLPMASIADLVLTQMRPGFVDGKEEKEMRNWIRPLVWRAAAAAYGLPNMQAKTLNGKESAVADSLSREKVRNELKNRVISMAIQSAEAAEFCPDLARRFEEDS